MYMYRRLATSSVFASRCSLEYFPSIPLLYFQAVLIPCCFQVPPRSFVLKCFLGFERRFVLQKTYYMQYLYIGVGSAPGGGEDWRAG